MMLDWWAQAVKIYAIALTAAMSGTDLVFVIRLEEG
jgi:hypothetical protein